MKKMKYKDGKKLYDNKGIIEKAKDIADKSPNKIKAKYPEVKKKMKY